MAEHLARGVKEAAALLAQAEYCIALTGAGVSTESGIPDFRSPGSGLWTRLDPMFFTIESFKADPAQFYRLGQELFAVIKEAEPNDTHIVLGELEKRGLVKAIITQNIDGLHQKGPWWFPPFMGNKWDWTLVYLQSCSVEHGFVPAIFCPVDRVDLGCNFSVVSVVKRITLSLFVKFLAELLE